MMSSKLCSLYVLTEQRIAKWELTFVDTALPVRVGAMALRLLQAEDLALAQLAASPMLLDESVWGWLRTFTSAKRPSAAAVLHPLRGRASRKRFEHRYARGFVHRDFDDPMGRFASTVIGDELLVEAEFGDGLAVLEVRGSRCVVKLRDPLPQTMVTALRGVPISAVIAHEVFDGSDWLIARVSQGPGHGRARIVFDTAAITLPVVVRRMSVLGGRP